MAEWRVSRRADRDLLDIFQHSLDEWGEAQATKYLDELRDTFGLILKFPLLGRRVAQFDSGLHRINSGRHVVFYRPTSFGIRISRVLHESQDFARHL